MQLRSLAIAALSLTATVAIAQTQKDGIYIDGSVYVNGGEAVQIFGNVSFDATAVSILEDSAKVSFYGKTLKMAPGAKVYGTSKSWTSFTNGQGAGRIIFQQAASGPAQQQILDAGYTGNSAQNTLGSVEINNPGGVILVGTDARFGTNVTFTTGHLYTNANDALIASNATLSGYDASKYVVTAGAGHLVKESFTGAFQFPVGQATGDYTPATITNAAANTVHVSVATYANSASAEAGNNGMDRTWNIFGQNSSGATLSLQHNSITNQPGFSSISNFVTQYGVAPNPTGDNASLSAWQSNTPGACFANGGTEVRSRSYSALTTTATANEAFFSKASNTTNPLPITLKSFAGQMLDCSNARLIWSTATEEAGLVFELQQSTDGQTYAAIATIAGKGQGADYSVSTAQAKGAGIYRLQMMSKTGAATYSQAVTLISNCGSEESFVISPNPLTGNNLMLQFNTAKSGAATALVSDSWGRTYMQQAVVVAQGANTYSVSLADAPAGMYFVRIIGEGGSWATQTIKLQVTH